MMAYSLPTHMTATIRCKRIGAWCLVNPFHAEFFRENMKNKLFQAVTPSGVPENQSIYLGQGRPED